MEMIEHRKTEIVVNWMTKHVITLNSNSVVSDAVELLKNNTIFGIPVVDNENNYLGLVSKTNLMNHLATATVLMKRVTDIMTKDSETISPYQTIDEASKLQGGCLPVVDESGKLVGIITRTDIIRANSEYIYNVKEEISIVETLQSVLNATFEGIVIVDKDGFIIEMNQPYCRLLNRQREDVIGKHCSEIIDNTRLHIVAKTGVVEKGNVQQINGNELLVHRIPFFQNGESNGAIGMLIFKDLSEMQELYLQKSESKDTLSTIEKEKDILQTIIGESKLMKQAKKIASKSAKSASNIMISGSSGTGKEVFAKAIHDMSSFAKGKFIAVNCSAIPESLLESELFGYEEGSFTDAKKGGKLGKFEAAENGTIFLDEIGDMPLSMQAKLLRVLQNREIEKIGGTEPKAINVRVISATHRDLKKMVEEGTFREDLFYRINVINIDLPDLSQREEDVFLFLNQFMAKHCELNKIPRKTFSNEAKEVLASYNWPGNIREVMNICEALSVLVDGEEIEVTDLPSYMQQTSKKREFSLVEEKELEMIQHLLEEYRGNKTLVAETLSMSRSTLYNKMKKYHIE